MNLLSITSGLYLGVSIYRIHKLIKEKQIQVNTKIMMIHVATLGIFVLSFSIDELAFLLHPSKENNAANIFM